MSKQFSFAQNGTLLWHKKNTTTIALKWYKADNQYYADGCNVYRKINNSDWVKINPRAIRKQDFLSPELIKRDSSLLLFTKIFEQVPVYEIEGFLMVNLIIKSFESNEFSNFLGNYYEDKLPPNTPITSLIYKVVYNKYGKEVLVAKSNNILLQQPESQIALDLIIDQKKKVFKFSWNPKDDLFYAVDLYKRKVEDDDFTKVNALPILTNSQSTTDEVIYRYEDANIEKNNQYEYYIQGLGYFENETVRSKTIKISYKDSTGPPPAYNLKRVLNKDGSLVFTWDNPTGGLHTSIKLYSSTKSDGEYSLVATKPINKGSNTLTLKTFNSGTHYFLLKTFDDAENFSKSNTVFINIPDLTAPDKPQKLTIKADTGRVVLNWESNTEPDLMGYYIYRSMSTNNMEKFVLMNGEAIANTQFIDSLPKNLKNNIYYKVLAVDSSFNKSTPSKIKFTQLPDAAAPSPPFINKVINNNGGNEISWFPSTSKDVSGYNVFRSEDDLDSYTTINNTKIDSKTSIFRDTRIEGGKMFTYYITAYDSAGNTSIPSNKYSVKAKYASSIQEIVLSSKFDRKKNQVALNWSAKENKNLLGFIVFRKENTTPYVSLTKLTKDESFLDKELEETKTYSYQIKGYYKGGVISISNEVGTK